MDDQYFPTIEVYNNIKVFKFNFIKVGVNAWIPSKVKEQIICSRKMVCCETFEQLFNSRLITTTKWCKG